MQAKEYRFKDGNWQQIAGEINFRAEDMGGFKEKAPIFEFPKKAHISSQLTTKNCMKQYLEALVSKGKLTEALELMSEISNTQNRDFQTTVILLSAQNAGNENDNLHGFLDSSDYKRSKAKINYAILQVLEREFDESKAPAPPKSDKKEVDVAKNTPIVSPTIEPPVVAAPKKTILFITSSPNNLSVPNVGRQQRVIKEAMKDKRKEDFYDIKTIGFVQPEDLIDEIEEAKADIIHFFMHNDTNTGLFFEKGNGEVVQIEPRKMTAIFKVIAKNKKIECVVLNACNSVVHVEAIKPFVTNIVYTNDFVPDSISEGNNDTIASLFARKFYEQVFSGKDYAEALERANTALSLSDMPLPKNKKKEIDEIYAISTQ